MKTCLEGEEREGVCVEIRKIEGSDDGGKLVNREKEETGEGRWSREGNTQEKRICCERRREGRGERKEEGDA